MSEKLIIYPSNFLHLMPGYRQLENSALINFLHYLASIGFSIHLTSIVNLASIAHSAPTNFSCWLDSHYLSLFTWLILAYAINSASTIFHSAYEVNFPNSGEIWKFEILALNFPCNLASLFMIFYLLQCYCCLKLIYDKNFKY